MSDKLEKIAVTLREVTDEMAKAIQEAYIDGFNAGSAYDKPTQEQFDDRHQQPEGYGEDGEIWVIAGSYTHDEALHVLKTLFDKELYDYDGIEDLDDHMQRTKIAYIPEDIASEPGYYYRRDGSGVYDAWVWTA